MKKFKAYLIMWYASFVFLGLGMVFFGIGMFFPRLHWWIPCILMLIIFARLFIPSNKALMRDEGYTIPEARAYYKACNKAGYGRNFDLEECRKIAARFPYASKLDNSALRKLYDTGRTFFRLLE